MDKVNIQTIRIISFSIISLTLHQISWISALLPSWIPKNDAVSVPCPVGWGAASLASALLHARSSLVPSHDIKTWLQPCQLSPTAKTHPVENHCCTLKKTQELTCIKPQNLIFIWSNLQEIQNIWVSYTTHRVRPCRWSQHYRRTWPPTWQKRRFKGHCFQQERRWHTSCKTLPLVSGWNQCLLVMNCLWIV